MHSQTSKHGAGQRPCVLILFELRAPRRRQPRSRSLLSDVRKMYIRGQSIRWEYNQQFHLSSDGRTVGLLSLDSIYLSVRSICPEVMMRSNNGGADGLRDGKTKTVSRERANGSSEPNRWRSTAGLRRRQHFRQKGRRIFHCSIQIRNARCC